MECKVTLLKLFLVFLKMGTVTFGGGVTMAPLLMKEVVEKRHWIDEADLTASFALSQSLPGVVAVNVAVFIGHKVRGPAGAAAAAVACATPAVVGIIGVVALLNALPIKDPLTYGLKGVKSASVALIICTAVKMSKTVIVSRWDKILFGAALLGAVFLQVNAILLVCSFALIGCLNYGYEKWKKDRDV